jgi:hypothetical protein
MTFRNPRKINKNEKSFIFLENLFGIKKEMYIYLLNKQKQRTNEQRTTTTCRIQSIL